MEKLMYKLLFFIFLLASKSILADVNLTQKQINSPEEGPYCEYNFSNDKQNYKFSKFDECGDSQIKDIGGNYYLLELISGRPRHTYVLNRTNF